MYDLPFSPSSALQDTTTAHITTNTQPLPAHGIPFPLCELFHSAAGVSEALLDSLAFCKLGKEDGQYCNHTTPQYESRYTSLIMAILGNCLATWRQYTG